MDYVFSQVFNIPCISSLMICIYQFKKINCYNILSSHYVSFLVDRLYIKHYMAEINEYIRWCGDSVLNCSLKGFIFLKNDDRVELSDTV